MRHTPSPLCHPSPKKQTDTSNVKTSTMKKSLICAVLACFCLTSITSCTKNDVPTPNENGGNTDTENQTIVYFTGSTKNSDGIASRTWVCTKANTGSQTVSDYIGKTLTMDSNLEFSSDISEFGDEGSWSVDGNLLSIHGQNMNFLFGYTKLASDRVQLQEISDKSEDESLLLEFATLY